MSADLDLKQHIETAGHQINLCPHVTVDSTSCRGYLHKLGATFHGWSRRWFVLDRQKGALIYYSDKSERKPRGGSYFTVSGRVGVIIIEQDTNCFPFLCRQSMRCTWTTWTHRRVVGHIARSSWRRRSAVTTCRRRLTLPPGSGSTPLLPGLRETWTTYKCRKGGKRSWDEYKEAHPVRELKDEFYKGRFLSRR